MNEFISLTIVALHFSISCNSEYVSNVRSYYDYVIVGGGTSGAVLANRLSANSAIQVLLLEAGSVPDEATNIPFFALTLINTEIDWQYKSIPQNNSCYGLREQRSNIPRGKVLGGTSSINSMLFVRGNKKDYDNWAKNGAEGWSWEDVFPFFTKWENNKDDFVVSNGYHGVNGEMPISRTNYYTPLAQAYVKAAKELGFKQGDFNGPDPESFMQIQKFVNNGRRSSTYEAFLRPVEHRKNLHIAIEAFVTKILFDSNKRAIGVQFEHRNTTKQVRVTKEVILSAGVISSPQILMLSGIGPRGDLRRLGIPVLSDLPVGQNLQDHVTAPFPFTLEKPMAFNFISSLILGILPYYFRRGPFTSAMAETIGFLTTKYNNHKKWPDIELMFASISVSTDGGIFSRDIYGVTDEFWKTVFKPYVDNSTFLCFSVLLHPESVGELKLVSTDPHQPPLINPNYFDKPRDIKVLVEGIKKCLEIGSTETMKKFGTRPFYNIFPGCQKFKLFSDEYLACVARVFTITHNHHVGTCKMGKPGDPTSVVDPQLRVKGVKGLRVVDASIMPTVISGHTEAATIMIGEKGSHLILNDLK